MILLKRRIKIYKGYLIDLDGIAHRGTKVIQENLEFVKLTMLFSTGLVGCEQWDRYSPFTSKTDVYGVIKGEATQEPTAPKDVIHYSLT